ncbi:Protein phosphatase PP2A regulatory subunit A [Grifola frondosa]|uniref:Protein phosphatase PP2A regulatory subunit A n=1 Tax=Grifola frondosa TaxID=5627 RepID=A0A1C7MXJ2_GRIFR|nr:Protein phosphatase PP2A regulatory subunit A [Grifola frondosa]
MIVCVTLAYGPCISEHPCLRISELPALANHIRVPLGCGSCTSEHPCSPPCLRTPLSADPQFSLILHRISSNHYIVVPILQHCVYCFVIKAHSSLTMDQAYSVDEIAPIAILMDELRSEDVQLRLNAIHRISTIALALGPERAREELIPFLQDSVDDEDEVLLALAEELGRNFEEYIGGKETLVRDKATESITKISSVLSQAQIEQFYIPLVQRLSRGEWFTSRTSSCALYAPVYDKVAPNVQDELRKGFATLGTDDTPMVRRAAAKWLGPLVKKFSKAHVLTDGLNIYRKLQSDDQDSVRLLTVEDLIAIVQQLSPAEVKDQSLVKQIRQTVSDKSWRVRYMAASHFNELAETVGQELVREELIGHYVLLLKDNEAEVRTAAAGQIPGFAKLLEKEDEFPEVRLNIISKLEQVNTVIGIELLSESLLPAIVELAEDKSWRVRQAIIEYIPLLATQLGKSFFDEQLGNLCMSWLGDNVYSIREAATINLKKLTEAFGVEWAKVQIVPKVVGMGQHPNYLYRMTTVQAIMTIAPSLTLDIVRGEILDTLLQLAGDPIPNIRFNVAKALEVLATTFGDTPEGKQLTQQKIVPVLEAQRTDQDADVRFFAQRALQKAQADIGATA